MFYVYAISSEVKSYIYIGITDNLERRLNQHQNGYNKTTRPYRPFRLIFSEQLSDRKQARIREKYFKITYGRMQLKQMLT